MQETVVVGLGNVLMRDEGVGILLVKELAQRASRALPVDFLDLGSGGFNIVHAIAGKKRAVFIDCAFMDEQPGEWKRFTPEDVSSVKQLSAVSGHSGDLLAMLEVSRGLGECPPEVVIFGIQPALVEQGQGLSEVLAGRFTEYLRAIEECLAEDAA